MRKYEELTGPKIRKLRHRRGLTLDQFWLRLGISRGMGGQYERQHCAISNKVKLLVWLFHIASTEEALAYLGKTPTTNKETAT